MGSNPPGSMASILLRFCVIWLKIPTSAYHNDHTTRWGGNRPVMIITKGRSSTRQNMNNLKENPESLGTNWNLLQTTFYLKLSIVIIIPYCRPCHLTAEEEGDSIGEIPAILNRMNRMSTDPVPFSSKLVSVWAQATQAFNTSNAWHCAVGDCVTFFSRL